MHADRFLSEGRSAMTPSRANRPLRHHRRPLPGNARDGGGEIIRRLRAADREAGIEKEGRYPLDARVLGGIGFALDGFDIVIAAEPPPDEIAVHAALLRG